MAEPKVIYNLEVRPGGLYAVMRRGPKGGERVIDVWTDRDAAEWICRELNAHAGDVA